MKLIANPPFYLCGRRKKQLKELIDFFDDFVILATYTFCNTFLRKTEYIPHDIWPVAQSIAISAMTMEENYVEMPKFYQLIKLKKNDPGREKYFYACTTHFLDPGNCYHRFEPLKITDEAFIRKTGSYGGAKKGTEKEYIRVYPWFMLEVFEKNKEQIFKDSEKYVSPMVHTILIRQSFVDEYLEVNKDNESNR